jgi:hypothetical protein
MAMLSWLKLNPSIKIDYTLKRFRGIHSFKLKVYAPGFRMATHLKTYSEKKIRDALALRQEKAYDTVPAYRGHRLLYADATQLMYLIVELSSRADSISIRIEEPHVIIYSDDEAILFDIANNMPRSDLTPYSRILEFTHPHENTVEDLKNNIVFVKTPPKHKFRVVTREGIFTESERTALLNYLTSISVDEAIITDNYKYQLGKKTRTWLSRSHILLNDERVLTMLKLISPSIISKIYEVKVLPL